MKFVLLGLEGVLIFDKSLSLMHTSLTEDQRGHAQTKLRNHAREFLDYCFNTFDGVILNTRVSEELARRIMAERFGIQEIGYWPCRKDITKSNQYELFKGHTLVHVDSDLDFMEIARVLHLGFHYIPVNPVNDYLIIGSETSTYDSEHDTDLQQAQIQIEAILN